ncbi:mandelate racemase/muconate lactonizing enzyme family protein [Dactylosporangium sp. CA-233914]|uniref:mandelate racemase/muconate lactonizing enzyme family protein n=1 Tax=Dactylosporangium sp. CA-233914 TaxID=3239934 RepID=UPI003D8FEA3D
MKIESFVLHRVNLPLRRPHRWAGLTEDIGRYLLLEVVSDSGGHGWGEATALASWGGDHGRYYGETLDTADYVLRELVAPAVLGVAFTDRHEILALADAQVRGHPYAKTAFQCAVLDLLARDLGVPVYELLGGKRRDRIELGHSIGFMDTTTAVAEVLAAVAEGVRAIKVKVGQDADREVELIRRIHEEVGDTVHLAVDANRAWSSAVQAERVLRRLADVPLRYVEQPTESLAQLESLAARIPFPVMADESMWTAYDMAEIARHGIVQRASIYTSKAGGPIGALAADAVATAFGIGTNVNGSGETGVGNLANLHLAAAMTSMSEACLVPLSTIAEDPRTTVAGRMYLDDVLTESMDYVGGDVMIPTGPGWGIDVDAAKMERYTVSSEVVRK